MRQKALPLKVKYNNKSEKIKVLRIIARLNIGGPAIHTVLLTEGLDKDKFESILVAGRVDDSEGDMRYYVQKKNTSPVIIPQLQRKINVFNDFIAFVKIYQLIKKEKPIIVHTHTAKAGALGRLAALCAGVPIRIHTFHGHVFQSYFSKTKTLLFIIIEKIMALFTDRIIAVSPRIRNDLLRLGIAKERKIITIPLGLELDELLRLGQRDSQAVINVGIIGRLTEVKNHKFFFQVVKKLQDSPPENYNVEFKIIGDGHLKDELLTYSHTLGLKNIEFKGWIMDIKKIYEELDIVVLTSFNEGTPISLIEAMAAARPVIATKVGGVEDIINDERGFLVTSGDTKGFVNALDALLRNGELRIRLGQAGREFVRCNYIKNRLIKDIKELYEAELKEHKI